MIASGHTSIGIILGVAATELLPGNIPITAKVLMVGFIGIASHYVMDLVPHGHYEIDQAKPTRRAKISLLIDLCIPILLLAIYLLLTHGLGTITWLVGAGVFGAQLPDILNGLRSQDILPRWKWLDTEATFHSRTHWHNPTDHSKSTSEGGRKLGISDIWQLTIFALSIYLLLRSLHF